MALDQEYYEKALAILQSKGFSDNEADQIATTLSVYLPMRFINADDWAHMPYDQHPANPLAFRHMRLLDRIPELKKPVILQMPTDFTYTTYGQEYCPGADAAVYTTGPDGYTHHPVGWESGITGMPGKSGQDGIGAIEIDGMSFAPQLNEFKYVLPPEPLTRQVTIVIKQGNKTTTTTLEELIANEGDFNKLPASAKEVLAELWAEYNSRPANLTGEEGTPLPKFDWDSLPAHLLKNIPEERVRHLKLDDLSDIEGIKRAYPNITDEEALRLSDTHRLVAQRLSMRGNPDRQPSLFERLMDPEQYGQDLRHSLGRLNEKTGPRQVSIRRSFNQVWGGGLVLNTSLFNQSYKRVTGPQTMPGLEKGLNGKPQRRKKGKGKRYDRGY